MQSSEIPTIKLIVVGDGSVGKTCILLSYTTDKFPHDYVPTVFENYQSNIKIDGKDYTLTLWDTAGQEGYDKLRLLSYQGSDIYFIVFSVAEPSSFENAITKWYQELKSNSSPSSIIIFVGNKIDMREGNLKAIRKEAAEKVITDMGCKYCECSALTQEGLKEVFDIALTIFVNRNKITQSQTLPNKKEKKKSHCQLI